jgi:penicillin-binding protein 1A
MENVVSSGTGTAAAIGRPLAGKTGTTENYGNAWFVGYVPQLSTAVWVGRPEGDTPMRNVHGISVTGGTYPARIFSRYMRNALAGVPVVDLYTASPDDLGLKSTISLPSTVPTPTIDSTTSTTADQFPTTTTTSTVAPTIPSGTVPRPTVAPPLPSTTAPVRPSTTTTVRPPPTTTTTTVRVQ